MAKRALLIGINKYRIPGADLRGCVNDVNNLQAALVKYFGFAAKEIKVVTDYKATQAKMQADIDRLIRGAKDGDVLLLHYSGHGANVPDDNGDEADFRDEILCPTNLDWNNPLTDDWLRKTFDLLGKKKVNLTVIMDCCHSGSNTRLLAPPDAPSIPRFLPCPLDLLAVESGRKLTGERRITKALAKRAATARKKDVVEVDMPEVLITGCRDTQTSADAFIDGSYNGALTFHLVKAINEKNGNVTYRDLHTRTIALLKAGRYDQVPQLEGRKENLDRPFLSPL